MNTVDKKKRKKININDLEALAELIAPFPIEKIMREKREKEMADMKLDKKIRNQTDRRDPARDARKRTTNKKSESLGD